MTATEQELLLRQEQPQRYIDVLLERITTPLSRRRHPMTATEHGDSADEKTEIRQVAATLWEYGAHRSGCAVMQPGPIDAPCNCGFQEALEMARKLL